MKALVVYESIFGNTRDIAEAIAEGLELSELEVELAEVGHAPKPDDVDLLVVGGPIHAWSMTRPATRQGARQEAAAAHIEPVSSGRGVREWLSELSASHRPAIAAAFDTAVQTRWFPTGSAARGEEKALRHAGYRIVAGPEHFYVKDSHGPLVDGERERARAWAVKLAEELVEPVAVPAPS
ncbi:MAG: flavodoxin family protein [Myxococcota bacterium]